MTKSRPIEERFWEKVAVLSENECWTWLASTNEWGYGEIGLRNKTLKAHRVSWMIHFGEIPNGLKVLHTCDNPPCVNPKHLFLGTDKDNSDDMNKKGRSVHPNKENHPKAILTEKDVIWMRNQSKTIPKGEKKPTYREWARDFGVSLSAIEHIIYGRRWR